ncbi:photosystem II cytochrome PsbV2 [Iningainema tapete]|uniref:Photosystem II cytochrome PsbV2 n=1 Tax=Iningainema tapete BLCC-T55 TaxID=2748662 RepID=A0A8J7C7H2_9CYAN|nr:photosystem II cytochrome PsbV2 [Iningainema tapete]MBD2773161.1 photosystem II cytochrome PsbV2 [Iningainema tapete BLCC-T55]
MLNRFFVRNLLLITFVLVVCGSINLSAQAANIDSYIVRYLHITEPINLLVDAQGNTRSFSPEDLSIGKKLFETNCTNCHVGGATLPNPLVSLSLKTLKGANPARDNINSLVAFMRQPMTYDGSEENYWCRQVPESWLSLPQVESLAAFILTAAQKAPGWGAENF